MADLIQSQNQFDSLVKENCQNNLCSKCNGELVFKTLKLAATTTSQDQHQQQQQGEQTSIIGYCLKCNTNESLTTTDNKKLSKKLFVLIETNNDEEFNLAINAIKSKIPDANVNVCESSSSSSTNTNIDENNNSKKNKNEDYFRNIRYYNPNRMLGSSCSSSGSSMGSSLDATRTSSLSLNHDNSIERQESKDSGFWSISKSSFESMKSLSINDTTINCSAIGSQQLTIPSVIDHLSTNDFRHNRRKWKKEHAWRYTNSSNRSNFDDSEAKPLSLSQCIIESIDESNEINNNKSKSLSKDNSLDIPLDTLNTNDNSDSTTSLSENSKGNLNSQKKRGKLIRDLTIDDENLMQSTSPNDSGCGSNATSNNDEKNEKNESRIKKFSNYGRVSPPEKRASLIEKQMSIDESYPPSNNELLMPNENNLNHNSLRLSNDFDKTAILNRMRATNHSKKLTNKYEKQDSYRNLSNNSYDDANDSLSPASRTTSLTPTRPKIPIVRVQSFIDYDNDDDHHHHKQQQHKNDVNLHVNDYPCPCCLPKSVSSSPSPTYKEPNCKNIIEHSNNSLDEALRTIKQHQQQQQQQQQSQEKLKHQLQFSFYPSLSSSTQYLNEHHHSHPHHHQSQHNLKLQNQKHSLDLDTKQPMASMFDPKSLSSSSLINHVNTMQTPPILLAQSSSLDRYHYNPSEFNLSKQPSPYLITKKFHDSENQNNSNNKLLSTKLYTTIDQHRYSEPMIKIDPKVLEVAANTAQTITASSSPSISPASYNPAALYLPRNEPNNQQTQGAFYKMENQQQPQYATPTRHLHFQQSHLQHPLYHLHQNSLSTSTPSINTKIEPQQQQQQQQQQQHKQEALSPASSPKSACSASSGLASSPSTLFKHEIFNAIYPYLHTINTKPLQTHGYPFHSFIQNNDLFLNFTANNNNTNKNSNPTMSQFTIPQFSNYNKIENEIQQQQQQQQQQMKFKTENDKSNQYLNKIENLNYEAVQNQNAFNMMSSKDVSEQNLNLLNMFSPISTKVNNKRPTNEINKPHICTFCQKKFARSDMLIRHSRLHSGVRPYKCNQCGQEFSRSDHLNTHQRTHTGEKPYRCPHPKCTYAACRKDMITRHLKVHNKNRSPSTSLVTNSPKANLIAAETTSRHTSSSSPSSLSLSISSPPHFTLSLTSPLMNLELASDPESQSNVNNNNNIKTNGGNTNNNFNDNSNDFIKNRNSENSNSDSAVS